MTPDEPDDNLYRNYLPEQVAAYMLGNDLLSQSLNMVVTTAKLGYSVLEMKVDARMLNGFGICHGGVITALADSAFAFACNSRNELSVASSISIEFLNSAVKNDLLVATAREVMLKNRLGLYEVQVVNQRNEIVALVTGRSYKLQGRYVIQEDRQVEV